MRLEQLHYCLVAAQCKTMSYAAKRLYLSQSALSIAIQNLENEIGFQIFKRSPQGITVTELGQEFLDKAAIIEQQLDSMKELGNEGKAIRNITIAVVPAACSIVTTELLRRIDMQNEMLSIDFHELRQNAIIYSLVNGDVDMVIGAYSPYNKERIRSVAVDNELELHEIYDDKLYAYLPRSHHLANMKCISFKELEGETPALFNDRTYNSVYPYNRRNLEQSYCTFSFSDQFSIKQVVASGFAFSIMPFSMSYDDVFVQSGRIKVVPIKDVDTTITIYIAYSNNHILREEKQLISDTMRDIFVDVDREAKRIDSERRSGDYNEFLVEKLQRVFDLPE